MFVRWRNLTGELLSFRGCQAWQSAHSTVLVTLSAGVSIDGKPMMRLKPHVCPAGTGHILSAENDSVFLVVYLPNITSFRIGDFEIG